MIETLFLSACCTLMFMLYSHPLILVVGLTIQTLPIFILLFYLSGNSWNTYVLFLIFLGGLLIIFIYISAMIPNEVFNKTTEILKMISSSTLILIIINSNLSFFSGFLSNYNNLIANFSSLNFSTTIPLMLTYLLAGLFTAAYLVEKMKKPLKSSQ